MQVDTTLHKTAEFNTFASLIKIAIDLTVLHSEHISVQSHVDYSILAEYNNKLNFIMKLLHDQEI